MDWVHCNNCFIQPGDVEGKKFVVTNCGHIYCTNCTELPNLAKCKICQSSYNTMPLSSKMRKEVEIYFRDPLEDIQKLIKILEFQQGHRMRLTTFNREKLLDCNSARNEIFALKEKLKLLHKENMSLLEENKRINAELAELKRTMINSRNHQASRNSGQVLADLIGNNNQNLTSKLLRPDIVFGSAEKCSAILKRPPDGSGFFMSSNSRSGGSQAGVSRIKTSSSGSYRVIRTSANDIQGTTPSFDSPKDKLNRKMVMPGDKGVPTSATRSAFQRLTLSRLTSTPKRKSITASKYFQYFNK